jgi:hypothetical protein
MTAVRRYPGHSVIDHCAGGRLTLRALPTIAAARGSPAIIEIGDAPQDSRKRIAMTAAIDRRSMSQGNGDEIAWRSSTLLQLSSIAVTIFLEGRKHRG